MLAVVVRLEERHAKVEFEHYATYRPDIAGLRPAQLQNDFRGAVMARRDDGAVMLMVECGAAEIDQAYVCAFHSANVAVLQKRNNGKNDESRELKTVDIQLTFLALNVVVYSEFAKRIFSGFRSVCVSLLSCKNLTE